MLQYEELRLKLQSLKSDIDNLKNALGLERVRRDLEELEIKASVAGFWEQMNTAQPILQRIAICKETLSAYNSLLQNYNDAATLIELAIEESDESLIDECTDSVNSLEVELEKQKLSTLLKGEYDKNDAILTFHAGAGGTEAQDWVEMLYRMYTRWAEQHGFKYKILDYIDGDEAGIKSASIEISGLNAYGFLKCEAGVHRLVRISPFDSSGRRHTSFAALEVIPVIDDTVEIEIKADDLRIDTYRSGGAGGQHVNKTDSAVRITHLPTGIVVACQNERSQHQNKDVAMRMLKSKLVEIKEREHYDKIDDIKGGQSQIAWGSQIRSYVFMPYTLAKDHRTGFENGNVTAVMNGDLDGFINAYLIHISNKE